MINLDVLRGGESGRWKAFGWDGKVADGVVIGGVSGDRDGYCLCMQCVSFGLAVIR